MRRPTAGKKYSDTEWDSLLYQSVNCIFTHHYVWQNFNVHLCLDKLNYVTFTVGIMQKGGERVDEKLM